MATPLSREERWVARLAFAAVALVTALLVAGYATTDGFASLGGLPGGARLARMQALPYFRDGAFVNELPTVVAKPGMYEAAITDGLLGGQQRTPPSPVPLGAGVLDAPPSTGLRITWLGHASTLIELDGARILVDPMLSERASPTTLAGPRRTHPAPVPVASLLPVHAVAISHDHYDHLDLATVRALHAGGARFVVPLGIGAHLEAFGIPAASIRELAWWERVPVAEGVELVSTPGRHFSGRKVVDENATLWSGWAMIGPRHRVFYSGDTGLAPHFAKVGEELGPFDATLLEVGQSHPTWGDIHLGPLGAVEAHRALRGRLLVPVHWLTFVLAYHDWDAPVRELETAAAAAGVQIATPRPGEAFEPGLHVPRDRWWEAVR